MDKILQKMNNQDIFDLSDNQTEVRKPFFDLSNIFSSFAQSPEAATAGTFDQEGEAAPAPEGFAQDIATGLPPTLEKIAKQEGPKFALGLGTSIPAIPSDLASLNKMINDLAIDYAPKPISKAAEFVSPIPDFLESIMGRPEYDKLLNKLGIPSDASDPSQMAGEALFPLGLLTTGGKNITEGIAKGLKNFKSKPGGGLTQAANFLARTGRASTLDEVPPNLLTDLQIIENRLDEIRQAERTAQQNVVDAPELDTELINQYEKFLNPKKIKNVPVEQSKLDIDFLDITDSTYPELNYGVKSIHDDPGNIVSDLVKTRPVHFNAEIVATNILKDNPNGLKGKVLVKKLKDFGGISKKELQDTGLLKFENSDDIIMYNKDYEGVPGNHLVNINTKESIDMTRNNNKVVLSSILKSDVDSRKIAYDDIIDRSLSFAQASKLYGISEDQYEAIISGAAREQIESGNDAIRIFDTSQRIPNFKSEQIDYGFLTINSKSGKKTNDNHATNILPLDKSRLAHSRFSIRQHPDTGKKYLVPEEWQTDFFNEVFGTKKQPGGGFRIKTGNLELDNKLIKDMEKEVSDVKNDALYKPIFTSKNYELKTNNEIFGSDLSKIFDEIDKADQELKLYQARSHTKVGGARTTFAENREDTKNALNYYQGSNPESFDEVVKIINSRLEKPIDDKALELLTPLMFVDDLQIRLAPDQEKLITTVQNIFGFRGSDYGVGNRFANKEAIDKGSEFYYDYFRNRPSMAKEISSIFGDIRNFNKKYVNLFEGIKKDLNLKEISDSIIPKKININEQLPDLDEISTNWMNTYIKTDAISNDEKLKEIGERVNNYEPVKIEQRSISHQNKAKILQYLHEKVPGLKANTDAALKKYVTNELKKYPGLPMNFEIAESEILLRYDLNSILAKQLTDNLHYLTFDVYKKKPRLLAKQITNEGFLNILNKDDIKDPLLNNIIKSLLKEKTLLTRLRGAKDGPEYQPFSDSKEWVKILARDYLRLAADLDVDGIVFPNPASYMSAGLRGSKKVQRFYEDIVMNQIAKVAKETGKDVDTIEWKGWNQKRGDNRYGDQHKIIETDPNLKGRSIKGYKFGGLVGSLNGINVLDLGES